MIIRKTSAEVEEMRVAGQMVARCLREIKDFIVAGKTTTLDIDIFAEQLLRQQGVGSSFKGYRGYPNTVCVAVNEEVVHGIPSERVLNPGDIVGIDLGVIVNDWQGDAAITVAVGGNASKEAEQLIRVTREALMLGIDQARPGKRLGDIGHAIQVYVERYGYSVVRELVGHGIGRDLHEDPQVPNYGAARSGIKLEVGMVLAIEPMVNMGGWEVKTLPDKWTVVTRDRSLSAHFEHTVAIMKNGPDILTIESSEDMQV